MERAKDSDKEEGGKGKKDIALQRKLEQRAKTEKKAQGTRGSQPPTVSRGGRFGDNCFKCFEGGCKEDKSLNKFDSRQELEQHLKNDHNVGEAFMSDKIWLFRKIIYGQNIIYSNSKPKPRKFIKVPKIGFYRCTKGYCKHINPPKLFRSSIYYKFHTKYCHGDNDSESSPEIIESSQGEIQPPPKMAIPVTPVVQQPDVAKPAQQPPEGTKEGNYKCSKCGRVFQSPTELTNHLNVHILDKFIECQKCSKTFQTPRLLRWHIKHEHAQGPEEKKSKSGDPDETKPRPGLSAPEVPKPEKELHSDDEKETEIDMSGLRRLVQRMHMVKMPKYNRLKAEKLITEESSDEMTWYMCLINDCAFDTFVNGLYIETEMDDHLEKVHGMKNIEMVIKYTKQFCTRIAYSLTKEREPSADLSPLRKFIQNWTEETTRKSSQQDPSLCLMFECGLHQPLRIARANLVYHIKQTHEIGGRGLTSGRIIDLKIFHAGLGEGSGRVPTPVKSQRLPSVVQIHQSSRSNSECVSCDCKYEIVKSCQNHEKLNDPLKCGPCQYKPPTKEKGVEQSPILQQSRRLPKTRPPQPPVVQIPPLPNSECVSCDCKYEIVKSCQKHGKLNDPLKCGPCQYKPPTKEKGVEQSPQLQQSRRKKQSLPKTRSPQPSVFQIPPRPNSECVSCDCEYEIVKSCQNHEKLNDPLKCGPCQFKPPTKEKGVEQSSRITESPRISTASKQSPTIWTVTTIAQSEASEQSPHISTVTTTEQSEASEQSPHISTVTTTEQSEASEQSPHISTVTTTEQSEASEQSPHISTVTTTPPSTSSELIIDESSGKEDEEQWFACLRRDCILDPMTGVYDTKEEMKDHLRIHNIVDEEQLEAMANKSCFFIAPDPCGPHIDFTPTQSSQESPPTKKGTYFCSRGSCNNKSFNNVGYYRIHVISDHRRYESSPDSEEVLTPTLQDLIQAQTPEGMQPQSLKCGHCDEEFSSKCDLDQHIRENHSNEKRCPVCSELFRSKKALKDHAMKEHESKIIRCIICKTFVRDKFELQVHLAKCLPH